MTTIDRLFLTACFAVMSAVVIYATAVTGGIYLSVALAWAVSAGGFLAACGAPDADARSRAAADELTRLTDEMGLYRTDQEDEMSHIRPVADIAGQRMSHNGNTDQEAS